MRLHEIPIQDVTLGVQQIHSQLQNLCLEMQSLKKEKEDRLEAHEEVWCLKCKIQGHDKDHFPVFANYITGGGLIPLRQEAFAGLSAKPVLWCAICHVAGKNVTDNCYLLQKFIQMPQKLFCDFFKSVGHHECHYRSYKLMMERMPTYRMQAKMQPPDHCTRGVCEGYQG